MLQSQLRKSFLTNVSEAYDITQPTTELRTSGSVRFSNQMHDFIGRFRGRGYRKHVRTVKIITIRG